MNFGKEAEKKRNRVWRRGVEESHGGREKLEEVQFSQQVSAVRHLSKTDVSSNPTVGSSRFLDTTFQTRRGNF